MKNGYADARILSATADLDRDGRGFFITFTIDEGPKYRFGDIDIETTLPSLDPRVLRGSIATKPAASIIPQEGGEDGRALTIGSQQGYAFAQVRL
jgi:outer membrane protein insertion porin family